MDRFFLATVFDRPPALLGRQLKPLCCGHCVLLAAWQSPFGEGVGEVTEGELLAAIWICSQTYEEGRRALLEGGEDLVEQFTQWGRSIGPFDFLGTNAIFQKYFEDHSRAPDRWQSKDARPLKTPWPLAIATTLMRELHFTSEQAWNMPLQEAFWFYASLAEADGDDTLVSETERRRLEAARAARRAATISEKGSASPPSSGAPEPQSAPSSAIPQKGAP